MNMIGGIDALDSHASQSVLEVVEKRNEQYGTTIIIITHNEAIAARADQIVHVKDGKVPRCRWEMGISSPVCTDPFMLQARGIGCRL